MTEGYQLHTDSLTGARAIAGFLYGDEKKTSKVYRLAKQPDTPIFRLGWEICARRSTIMKWIQAKEADPAPASYSETGNG